MKRSWVLHECLERVPEDFEAMHELLKYGLRGTDLEAMIALGNRTDNGRSVIMIVTISQQSDNDCQTQFLYRRLSVIAFLFDKSFSAAFDDPDT